jgi:site-specific DNA-methyltransferase (adenine-specific)
MFVDWRNLPAMTDAVQMAGWVWRGVVVWDKGISRNQPGRFRNDCEFVVWCSNGDLPIDWKAAKGTKAMPGVYHVPIVAPKQRFHQTEKPVELLESLLAICTPGGTVLDAFMGSGSTGVAAVKTGRSFIGMELSDQYFDTATKRIQEAEDELLNDF